jgi:hypothetical protein
LEFSRRFFGAPFLVYRQNGGDWQKDVSKQQGVGRLARHCETPQEVAGGTPALRVFLFVKVYEEEI